MADDTQEQELKNQIQIIQSMIDASAERLEGLRTQCATSAELTQHEIRTLEVSFSPRTGNVFPLILIEDSAAVPCFVVSPLLSPSSSLSLCHLRTVKSFLIKKLLCLHLNNFN